MIAYALLPLLIVSLPDTLPRDSSATLPRPAMAADTAGQPRPRPRAISVSEGYARRLTIHRYGAYATIPLFAMQYVAGQHLYDELGNAKGWAKTTHRVGATALAAVFTVNTVTGVWNYWETRASDDKRALRTAHALLMLAADAGFTYAGVRLSDQAENDPDKRSQHRAVALSSMGLATAGGMIMAIWNR